MNNRFEHLITVIVVSIVAAILMNGFMRVQAEREYTHYTMAKDLR